MKDQTKSQKSITQADKTMLAQFSRTLLTMTECHLWQTENELRLGIRNLRATEAERYLERLARRVGARKNGLRAMGSKGAERQMQILMQKLALVRENREIRGFLH